MLNFNQKSGAVPYSSLRGGYAPLPLGEYARIPSCPYGMGGVFISTQMPVYKRGGLVLSVGTPGAKNYKKIFHTKYYWTI